MLLSGFFWRSNRYQYVLGLGMRALATSIHVRTYLPKFNKYMHYYDTYRGTMGVLFRAKLFSTKIWRQLGNTVLPSIIYQPLHTLRPEE